jgi:hypothetical protein
MAQGSSNAGGSSHSPTTTEDATTNVRNSDGKGAGGRTQGLWESQKWYPRDRGDVGDGDGDMPTFNVKYTDSPHGRRVRFSQDDEGNDWKVRHGIHHVGS